MTGLGRMTWPDGKIYEGGFLDDKKHGKGKLTSKEGKVTEGTWVDGKLSKDSDGAGRRSTKAKKSESKNSFAN